MNKKSIYRCWVGITIFLIALISFTIGKWAGCGKRRDDPSHYVAQNDSSSAIGKDSGPKKYIPNSGPEVLRALEERAKHPTKEDDHNFYGLTLAPALGTERLVLRGMNSQDLNDLAKIFSDYETIYMLAFMPWPFDRDHVKIYMMNLGYAMENGHSLYWAITLPKEDRLIGVIGLTLDHVQNRAEMHYWLDKEHWGKGYMTEAAKRIIHYVFCDLELNRLDINHLNENTGSQRVIEKCGFTFECQKDEFCKKEKEYKPMKFYRILRREYLNVQ
ncbi:MAG: GNAT family N-acetyltransferase [Puniceicoccales bacterium]|jgi:RimJ/RimL family protein N-acetyltransferase|nr:GNAT family N-acetyltransferase [Puniceicoccales bacterium]